MKVVIAEKPSVARSIAKVIGANQSKEGYMTGNGYSVTWAFGHLIALAQPREYGFKNYERASLPMLPQTFKLVPRQIKAEKGYTDDPGALKQLKVIENLFQNCSEIIVATDAGREGELIFRYIYNYLNCTKPFSRLWISSLTDKAIKEGFDNLHNGSEFNNLFLAAETRSHSDWLIGMNASQALTLAAGQGVYSLGRVQTPTLKMICNRYQENHDFKPETYFQIKLSFEKDGILFHTAGQKHPDRESVNRDMQILKASGKMVIDAVERKEAQQETPLLFDLTALQIEANNRYGFSADVTLSIAQKLYESRLITYPRTGSRFIPDDVFEEMPELISTLKNNPLFSAYAGNLNKSLNKKSVDTLKVTDHHALLTTGAKGSFTTIDEEKIYNLIAARMLEAFGEKCIKDVTTITLSCEGFKFTLKGTVMKYAGWRSVLNDPEEAKEDENNLPPLSEGETLIIKQAEAAEKQTKPRPLHSDASLLAAMETAGKDLINEEERAALKNIGIGTPATRAAVIETLLFRQYIRRDKKHLIPTDKGLTIFELVKSMKIADVAMTAEWETALAKIETGKMDAGTFRKAIEIYTAQITAELLNVRVVLSDVPGCLCPKCKESNVLFFPKVVKCSDVNCGLIVFRNKCDKLLSDSQITELLEKGKTKLIKGFKKKDSTVFDACLQFDEQYNVIFDFPKKEGKKKR